MFINFRSRYDYIIENTFLGAYLYIIFTLFPITKVQGNLIKDIRIDESKNPRKDKYKVLGKKPWKLEKTGSQYRSRSISTKFK